jgi:small subunit ribosomal protein S5
MAEKENVNEPKELIEVTPEEVEKLEEVQEKQEKEEMKEAGVVEEKKVEEKEVGQAPKKWVRKTPEQRFEEETARALEEWIPKTEMGMLVKPGKEKDLDKIIDEGKRILEPEIVDSLMKVDSDLLLIGQAKGKFGGGKRRAWRQTQKKTKEGNVLTFSCMAVVGDKAGHIGLGYGRAKETLPSRAKAVRKAKMNLMKIRRGWETPEEDKSDPHTVPFIVEGKTGSSRLRLIPAPRGTGLVIADECKKILKLAGIKDVYSMTKGQTKTTFNMAKACIEALKKTNREIVE